MKKTSKTNLNEKVFPFTSGKDSTNKGFAKEYVFIILGGVIVGGFLLLIGAP